MIDNKQLIAQLQVKAIELITEDKPGIAIAVLEAVIALNDQIIDQAFETRGEVVLDESL